MLFFFGLFRGAWIGRKMWKWIGSTTLKLGSERHPTATTCRSTRGATSSGWIASRAIGALKIVILGYFYLFFLLFFSSKFPHLGVVWSCCNFFCFRKVFVKWEYHIIVCAHNAAWPNLLLLSLDGLQCNLSGCPQDFFFKNLKKCKKFPIMFLLMVPSNPVKSIDLKPSIIYHCTPLYRVFIWKEQKLATTPTKVLGCIFPNFKVN